MKFTLKQGHQFGWDGITGTAYNSQEDFSNASAAYFEVTGNHGKIKTSLSDRIYYVVEGKGEFIIDEEHILVEKTDVIIVPKNTPYDYCAIDGILKLFLVHTPAYDQNAETKL